MTERKLLMIPGPIEFSENVLAEMGKPSPSHVAPSFIETFSKTIKMLRKVFVTEKGQPFVVAGSGTLGWDMAAGNLLEVGDNVLVVNAGYFGDEFGLCITQYGGSVTHVTAEIGDVASVEDIKKALKEKTYKLITITHVDTSTGVKSDIKAIAAAVREVSPDTYIAVDGVCATAGQELLMDEWGVDYVMTASQKALGVPPGLLVVCASQRALEGSAARKNPVSNYFVSWKRWLPIMQAYEECRPSYFATPAVNLINALNASLNEFANDMPGRFAAHEKASAGVKAAVKALGLKTVTVREELGACTLTTIRYPEGVDGAKMRGIIKREGIVVAGGLHKKIKAEYFRIGHMGISAVELNRGHLVKTITALETALAECGYKFEKGVAVNALKAVLEK